jgi:prephenate dehydrogenase
VKVAVVGVGLIGGSVALAARERLGAEVWGHDPGPYVIKRALERGAINRGCDDIGEAVGGAEAVFVAVPVGALPTLVPAVLDAASPGCVVTDVGSTKRAVVAAAGTDARFVGGHPLAGAETSGIEHARGDLFEGATWYLTPGPNTSGVLFERLHRLLRDLGARPFALEPHAHDRIMATISHLPHVLANVLVGQAVESLGAGDTHLPAAGPSFRDATRVAGAPGSVWTDIYLSNADALIDAIDDAVARLQEARAALEARESGWIDDWGLRAGAARQLVLEAQLGLAPLCELRVSVPNRPGVVAELALELGRAGVNIVDMALYPAPDMSEGVIALWIAGGQAAAHAEKLVAGLGFPVARA